MIPSPAYRRSLFITAGLTIYLCLWAILQIRILTLFPFVHSDEPWLSGLSRWMLSTGRLDVTEPFFDTYPRSPHAIKLLFHLLQSGWITLFGYSIRSVRMLSLCFGMLGLIQFYRLLRTLQLPRAAAAAGMIWLSCDIQFIYAAHMARQEIILVFLLITVLLRSIDFHTHERSPVFPVITGVIAGTAFGMHPNGVIIGAAGLSVYLLSDLQHHRSAQHTIRYAAGLGAVMALFLGISLLMNLSFFTDYAAYGQTLGVSEDLLTKITRYPQFFQKLIYRVSGTYHTPFITPQLVLFSCSIIAALVSAWYSRPFRHKGLPLLAALALMQVVFILIGRYGQPSVVLFFPAAYALTVLTLGHLLHRRAPAVVLLILIASAAAAVLSAAQISDEIDQGSYEDYTGQITRIIPEDAVVLGNLNTEYLFTAGHLYDWRNLAPAAAQGVSAEQYIAERGIEYVIYPEELDWIHANRPVWNGIYGNMAQVHPELQQVLNDRFELLYTGSSAVYAMRIVRYQQDRPWQFSIYRIIEDP